jgi:hypothetical protein
MSATPLQHVALRSMPPALSKRGWRSSRQRVDLHSYTAPGDGHGIFEYKAFYELEVNGEKLVDWVTKLIEGEPVDDAHCQKCRVG